MSSRTPAVRTTTALFALVVAAACSERLVSPAVSSADPASLNAADQEHGRVIMIPRGQLENLNAAAAKGGGGTGIFYHGGPVLQGGTKVAAVYWASSPIFVNGPAAGTTGSGANDGSLVGHFLRNLGGSPYFNINSSYTDGSGRALVNSVAYTQYWANNTNAPSGTTSISDAQMASMLQSGFASGALT